VVSVHIVKSPDCFSQNSRISDVARRQAKRLIPLNLISGQTLNDWRRVHFRYNKCDRSYRHLLAQLMSPDSRAMFQKFVAC